MQKGLEYYLHKFTHLRRDNKYGGAPHKPILLLSIIASIESGEIKNNRIFITPELIGVYKKMWTSLVKSDKHHCIFALPFYHLRTSGFWTLVAKRGFESVIQSKIAMKTFSNLEAAVEYVQIDLELFNFLTRKDNREILNTVILDRYFPETKNHFPNKKGNNYIEEIENQILNESPKIYKAQLQRFQNNLKTEIFEEEKFIRSNVFKRQIPLLYLNSCAISKLHIDTTINASLVDACHIVPFSNAFDDTITNGISLTPTLHRAFDRGLISIDEKYKVLVSKRFIEANKSLYSLKQFEGDEILLPKDKKYYPSLENLAWHRNNIFKS